MHAKTGLGEASSAGESRKSAADVADARAAATGQSLRPLGTVFVATWDRICHHLGWSLLPMLVSTISHET